MVPDKETPMYNLKAVVQKTGLKPDTLRAWERRYNIPTPTRTTGGHRLYSQRDIEMLQWLIARQQEGMNISRAVELWTHFAEEGDSPTAGTRTPAPPAGLRQPPQNSAGVLSRLRTAWVQACLGYDEAGADAAISEAFALFGPERVCIEVLQQGLATIGDLWYAGEATIQQEHFGSALAMRKIEALIAGSPPPTRRARILVGCPPEENHIFAPLMLTLLLRRRGWDTIYLGANIPVTDLEVTVLAAQPTLVILSAQQITTAATLLASGEALLHQRVPLAFGGLIFKRQPELIAAIAGHYLGDTIEGSVAVAEELATNPRVHLPARAVSQEYRAAHAHFIERQSLLEAELWKDLAQWPIPPTMLTTANYHFGRSIAAALSLGDLDFLLADMEWIEGLLIHHAGLPAEYLDSYVGSYLHAAERSLGPDGAAILAWLARFAGAQSASIEQRRMGHRRSR